MGPIDCASEMLKNKFREYNSQQYLLYFIYLQRIFIFDNAIALDLRFFLDGSKC